MCMKDPIEGFGCKRDKKWTDALGDHEEAKDGWMQRGEGWKRGEEEEEEEQGEEGEKEKKVLVERANE